MTARRYTVNMVVGVGHLLNRKFLMTITVLRAEGINIRAEKTGADLFQKYYLITLTANQLEAKVVDKVLNNL